MELIRRKKGFESKQKIESFSVQGDNVIYYAKTGEETELTSAAGINRKVETAIMTENTLKPKLDERVTIKNGKKILFEMMKFKEE